VQGFEKVNNSLQEQKSRAAHSVGPCEVCSMAVQRPAMRCAEHEHSTLASVPATPITIELTGEPRGKGRPRFTRAGIAYTPAGTRSYEAMLRLAAQDAMGGASPLEGALALTVEAYMPIPRSWSGKRQREAAAGRILPITRPDADNLMKPIDALNGVVWRDDAQIVSVSFNKRYSERPRLVVTVEALA
jgi:Holliday junction resolvase RusA-like endonuclease